METRKDEGVLDEIPSASKDLHAVTKNRTDPIRSSRTRIGGRCWVRRGDAAPGEERVDGLTVAARVSDTHAGGGARTGAQAPRTTLDVGPVRGPGAQKEHDEACRPPET